MTRSTAWAFGTAAVSAALSVVVNVATDLKSSALAWVAVVVLTVGSGVVAATATRKPHAKPAGQAATAPASSTPTMANYGKGRHIVLAGGPVRDIRTGPSPAAVVAIGLVVVLAMYGAFLAPAVAERIKTGPSVGAQATPGGVHPPASAAAPAPEPFTVSADPQNGLCSTWVTSQSIATINAALPIPDKLISFGNWQDWSPVADGAAASGQGLGPPGTVTPDPVTFTVEGVSDHAVTITDLKVRVTARRRPVRGISLTRECGDQGAFRWFTTDLDSSSPRISTDDDLAAAPEGIPPQQKVPLRLPYTVSQSDPETFTVQAVTEKCDCDWVLDLFWTSAGKRGVHTITGPGGHPFRTSSVKDARPCTILDKVECDP
jgi:hypothetical protein